MPSFTTPRSRTLGLCLFAATAASLLAPAARASLTLDLRSTDSSNPKLVYPPAGINYVLHFDLYAVVVGQDADPTNDGLQDAFFSLLSTNTVPPGLKGDLAISLVSPFDGVVDVGGSAITTSSSGTIQDLDGDGDLDIGSNDPTLANGWIFARSASMTLGQSQYLLAHVTFTPTEPFLAGETDAAVGLRLMTSALVIPAVWQEDGHAVEPTTGAYLTGTPVILALPEPATLTLLAPLALLTRRRR